MQNHRAFEPRAIRFLMLLFAMSVSIKARALADDNFTANTITLGIVSTSPQPQLVQHFAPFVSYVAQKLFATPKAEGKVRVVASLPELASFLDRKEIDFFMESPYPTYVVNQVRGAARLLLRRWKGGMAEYRSLIVTASDSRVLKLQDLRNKKIAFEDPESTSGYFLPKFFLRRNGFKLSLETQSSPEVPSGAIGYLFAGSIEKILELLINKQVAAGAMSDDDFAGMNAEKRAALRILAQTDLLPRHLVSVRKDLSPEASQRLAQILQAMNEDDTGQKILLNMDNTAKFDLLPGGEEAMRHRLLDTFYDPPQK